MKKFILICIALLSACGPASEQALREGLTYFKDKHGICYARYSSMDSHGYNLESITSVPCDKVGL